MINTYLKRPILLNEASLLQAVNTFLNKNYLFRKLEIEQWLGLDQILYTRKDEVLSERLQTMTAETLWHEGDLEDWATYKPNKVDHFYENFMWENMQAVGFKRKKLIKNMIREIISTSQMTETIRFDPKLKTVIEMGRQKVQSVKPLQFSSSERKPVSLEEGEACFLNWYSKTPYIANPAFVFKKYENSYRLLFFTNAAESGETSKLVINSARFLTVPADELGKTPEQAVLQRFC